MTEISVQELINRMPKAFMPEKAEGVDTVIQYHLTGEEGGDWIITINDGKCTVEPGVAQNPKMTLTVDLGLQGCNHG